MKTGKFAGGIILVIAGTGSIIASTYQNGLALPLAFQGSLAFGLPLLMNRTEFKSHKGYGLLTALKTATFIIATVAGNFALTAEKKYTKSALIISGVAACISAMSFLVAFFYCSPIRQHIQIQKERKYTDSVKKTKVLYYTVPTVFISIGLGITTLILSSSKKLWLLASQALLINAYAIYTRRLRFSHQFRRGLTSALNITLGFSSIILFNAGLAAQESSTGKYLTLGAASTALCYSFNLMAKTKIKLQTTKPPNAEEETQQIT